LKCFIGKGVIEMSTKINHTFSLLVMLVLIHLALTAVVAQQTFERSQQIQTSSPNFGLTRQTFKVVGSLLRKTAMSASGQTRPAHRCMSMAPSVRRLQVCPPAKTDFCWAPTAKPATSGFNPTAAL
jgi:hypothetical protein